MTQKDSGGKIKAVQIKEPIINLIKKNPVLSYFIITFLISWGGVIILGSHYGIPTTSAQFEKLWTAAVLPYFLGPTLAGLLMTGIVGGWAGFRELGSRLFKWKVNFIWYAIALLAAPLMVTPILIVFSLISPVFLPGIVTTADKIAALMTGIVTGILFGGLMEELGWTGFAVPALRQRHSIITTGLIVGVIHGVWHFPVKILISNPLGLAPYLTVDLLTAVVNLTAWRILMVWIYDRTKGSLLVTMLMHASLTGSTLFILAPAVTGKGLVIFNLVAAAAAWAVIAVVFPIERKLQEAKG